MINNKLKNSILVGCCYRVPVVSQDIVIVLVAAANGEGAAFGYFYRLNCSRTLDRASLAGISPEGALIRHQFGDLGVCNGDWPLIGALDEFSAQKWPFPPCVQYDKAMAVAFIKQYDPDTFRCIAKRKVCIDDPELRSLPEDSLWGYKLAEIKIARLLTKK